MANGVIYEAASLSPSSEIPIESMRLHIPVQLPTYPFLLLLPFVCAV